MNLTLPLLVNSLMLLVAAPFDDLLAPRPLWMLAGMVLATVIFWWINRRVLALQALAAEKLANTLNRTLAATEQERDEYRTKLHNERDEHQATLLKLKELESKPDLSDLTTLLREQRDWMKSLGDSLNNHAESDALIFKGILESVSEVPKQLHKMSKAFDDRQAAALAKIEKGDHK